jgi:hypothetical protein
LVVGMVYSDSLRSLPGIQVLGAGVAYFGITLPAFTYLGGGAQAAPPEGQVLQHVEAWSGGEVFQKFWSIYSGVTWAPFAAVRADGIRVRGVVGYGGYGSGMVTFGDLLVGYHKQLGPVTLKVFGGIAVADYRPEDPLTDLEGTRLGGKGMLEAWWTITDQAWASADLAWSSLHMDYNARIRLGWRFWPELSAGLEGGSIGTLERDVTRAGGFLRYEWTGGEVSISGGLAFEGLGRGEDGAPGAFGTVSVLTRF